MRATLEDSKTSRMRSLVDEMVAELVFKKKRRCVADSRAAPMLWIADTIPLSCGGAPRRMSFCGSLINKVSLDSHENGS